MSELFLGKSELSHLEPNEGEAVLFSHLDPRDGPESSHFDFSGGAFELLQVNILEDTVKL